MQVGQSLLTVLHRQEIAKEPQALEISVDLQISVQFMLIILNRKARAKVHTCRGARKPDTKEGANIRGSVVGALIFRVS